VVAQAGESPVVLIVPGGKSRVPRSTPVTAMTVDGKRFEALSGTRPIFRFEPVPCPE
jgi:hypothetical protein